MAESADDLNRLSGRQTIENSLQFIPRRGIVIAMKTNGSLPNFLDNLINFLAFLLAHSISEKAAQEPDVFPQRAVFLRLCQMHVWSGIMNIFHMKIPF